MTNGVNPGSPVSRVGPPQANVYIRVRRVRLEPQNNESRGVCPCCSRSKRGNMKLLLLGLALVGCAVAFPQKEGSAYTQEAIRQAQNTFLIPKDAQIQKVQEGIEIGAYESIPGNQKINLFEILGDQFPPEVVNNLQTQIDQVGKN
ncbi:unnamed protein product [Callosobruchus maculatus]|uniref:Uncharacterized protein n=1 Tax=Callosobruchus maculatus TaxID=64391 RepID=A0A653DPX9_CALMS|nr:unnamed protein product [Callosobruchus maculatus]